MCVYVLPEYIAMYHVHVVFLEGRIGHKMRGTGVIVLSHLVGAGD